MDLLSPKEIDAINVCSHRIITTGGQVSGHGPGMYAKFMEQI